MNPHPKFFGCECMLRIVCKLSFLNNIIKLININILFRYYYKVYSMAAEAFISYFEKLDKNVKYICIQDFFKSYFSGGTPVEMIINYNANQKDLIKQARNGLIVNLSINHFALNMDGYARNSIESIYLLLKATIDEANDDQIAQILFLLHCSKSNVNCDFFDFFFANMSTIHLTTIEEKFLVKVDPKKFFDSLKNVEIFQKIINKVVKDISGKISNFDYNACEITFFKSSFPKLNGFAGINQIYVSTTALEDIFLVSIYSDVDTLLILKMSLIRLILHELTNIVIRQTIQDFNLSSPILYSNTRQAAAAVACDTSKLIEAGVSSENELFNGKINWRTSATATSLNLEYCSNFLNKLLNNEMVDFSIESSGALLYVSPTVVMAVDYDFDYTPSIEFE